MEPSLPPPAQASVERARALVAAIPDPEIPVVTLAELGILRDVREEAGRVVVTLTPTYTGCPATRFIEEQVREALAAGGFAGAQVRTTLSPAWTTDWISEDGRRKLREFGIAPPAHDAPPATAVIRFAPRPAPAGPACPRCASADVERLAEHGSTPCKALYRCLACREPFDYFKPY